jgi:hypothetical protein
VSRLSQAFALLDGSCLRWHLSTYCLVARAFSLAKASTPDRFTEFLGRVA